MYFSIFSSLNNAIPLLNEHITNCPANRPTPSTTGTAISAANQQSSVRVRRDLNQFNILYLLSTRLGAQATEFALARTIKGKPRFVCACACVVCFVCALCVACVCCVHRSQGGTIKPEGGWGAPRAFA